MRVNGLNQGQSPGLSAGQSLLLLPVLLAMLAGALLGGHALLDWLHVDRCPAGTFFRGDIGQDLRLTLLLWPISAFLALCMIVRWFGWEEFKPGQLVSLPEDRSLKEIFFHSIAPWALPVLLVLTPFCTWLNAGTELCLASHGVTSRLSSIARVHDHAWSDVTAITTYCVQKSSKHGPFLLVQADFAMVGGDAFTLRCGDYARHARVLAEKLAGVPYRFTAIADAHCPQDERALLGSRLALDAVR